MKRLPLILVGVFLSITLARVAAFAANQMQAGVLGWLFAAGLGVAVYASSYWTRTAITRKAAGVALVFFIGIDAYFNFADVWLAVDTTNQLVAAGAVLYGLFPTVAVGLLGWLSGAIRKLPPDAAQMRSRRVGDALAMRIMRMLKIDPAQDAQPVARPGASPAQAVASDAPDALPYKCKVAGCSAAYAKKQSLSAHAKRHKREVIK